MGLLVVQEEWQRRQYQRRVWVLLGLLTVVSAAAGVPAPAAPPPVRASATCTAPTGEVETTFATVRRSSSAASARYWRGLARETDRRVRLRLERYAERRPEVRSIDRFLRTFIRPPTAH